MNARLVFTILRVAVVTSLAAYAVVVVRPEPPTQVLVPTDARPHRVSCPAQRAVVDIPATADRLIQRAQRDSIKQALLRPNTIVRLGPGVDLTFPFDETPLSFARCVTLTSASRIDEGVIAPRSASATVAGLAPVVTLPRIVEGRTPSVPGPVLRYVRRKAPDYVILLSVHCGEGDVNPADGVRISGFRLLGPDTGQNTVKNYGIVVHRCLDVEISNMEVAGWGGSGIKADDVQGEDGPPEPNGTGGRVADPAEIRIHDNFIHHNQYPEQEGSAQGYGVQVAEGAWAHIYHNTFDFNRHSIEASGLAGGYRAERNLVLKGGGIHGKWYNEYTHAFDVHGTGCWYSSSLCGEAGTEMWYIGNAFQYRKDNAIKIRGKPRRNALIAENVFPHPGLEDDWGDDAVSLPRTPHHVTIGSGNRIDFDSFGTYGVCDFDGDGIDDLFLPTGRSWWFSSLGKFQWTYLADRTERMPELQLGYFDDDLRCDVIAQEGDHWAISSGGTGNWRSVGRFGLQLSSVVFGRFDPADTDRRVGATRRTTHAFYRTRRGQWMVTSLAARDWDPVQSSSVPMDRLRFGDFTGDGVTDVLAVSNGRWSISQSARGSWRRLNRHLDDPVRNLFIANMDADDNIDDILRLDIEHTNSRWTSAARTRMTWYRSKNGREPWTRWKEYDFGYDRSWETVVPRYGFVGRFGLTPRGGTLVIDPLRYGNFHSDAARVVGASLSWKSAFPY